MTIHEHPESFYYDFIMMTVRLKKYENKFLDHFCFCAALNSLICDCISFNASRGP